MNGINRNTNSVLKGTTIAAGIGAGVGAGLNYARQKVMFKNVGKEINAIDSAFSQFSLMNPECKELFSTVSEFIKDGFSELKVDWKNLGRGAAIGATVLGGIYLAYRGIKSLFTAHKK